MWLWLFSVDVGVRYLPLRDVLYLAVTWVIWTARCRCSSGLTRWRGSWDSGGRDHRSRGGVEWQFSRFLLGRGAWATGTSSGQSPTSWNIYRVLLLQADCNLLYML
ncbi:hypothetical protein BJX63DRAFT_145966 [Aspergillus granulosus]|uniref:Secreted protein n=1 Tax=Aspergillus granulosus TaxID=176169 RepID=A0ABR4HMG1_9EURO